jgi:ABC-type microcin C transport system permease subunit YejB
MKGSTVGTLGEDFVTVARARGLKDWRITTAYVGRNAALPLFTQLTIAIGFVVGGSFLIETLFQYQGIGYVLSGAIAQRDYPGDAGRLPGDHDVGHSGKPAGRFPLRLARPAHQGRVMDVESAD